MSTARDLIKRSLRIVGVLAEGEAASAAQGADALTALNSMLDSWSIEGLTINARTTEQFTLTTSQQSRTWGAGGNFNSARPLVIESAQLRTGSGTTQQDYPMEIIDLPKWNAIPNKTLTGDYPSNFQYSGLKKLV